VARQGRQLSGQILARGGGPGARAPSGWGRGVKGVGWVYSGGQSWEHKGKGEGGVAVTDTLYRRRGGEWGTARERHHVVARGGGGAWGQRGGRVAWRGMAASGPVAAFMGSPCASETGEGGG
jgi:hypothetical protein